ncbi:MAG TPA: helix-turn-helix domain-containing protein, partial [Armatimonadota bacterium]|nr:helix-turn-helix domain-containing protein [Armatimonadota bacterium]
MDPETQKRLEADGWVVGDTQSFLGLSDAEMAYIDLALTLADVLKQRRVQRGLTQQQAAELLGTSQSRMAKMEAGHPSVTVDRLIRALFG